MNYTSLSFTKDFAINILYFMFNEKIAQEMLVAYLFYFKSIYVYNISPTW